MKKVLSFIFIVVVLAVFSIAGTCFYDYYFGTGEFVNKFIDTDKTDDSNDDNDIIINCEHEYDGYSTNDVQHYQVCVKCNKIGNEAEHEFEWIIDDPATIYGSGLAHEYCATCATSRNVGTVLEQLELNTSDLTWFFNNEEQIRNGQVEQSMTDSTLAWKANADGYYAASFNLRWDFSNTKYYYNCIGTRFNLNGKNGRILLRSVESSGIPYSLDISLGGNRYRIISDDIARFFSNVKSCGWVAFDFGAMKVDGVAYYGFRFITENDEISYFNNDSGTLKYDTVLFNAPDDVATSSSDTILLGALLSDLNYNPIGFSDTFGGITAVTYVGYPDYEDCTTLTAYNNSTWFKNKVLYN